MYLQHEFGDLVFVSVADTRFGSQPQAATVGSLRNCWITSPAIPTKRNVPLLSFRIGQSPMRSVVLFGS